ncbi:MAG: ubiquinone biosynthesis regulatory protein kinase UbiB [Gammaproteobacteria bacterium]
MRRYRLILRLLTIQRVLLKHGLDEVIGATHLLRPVGWLHRLLPRRGRRGEPLGVRLRLALEELGPIFVKFGQAVSTRGDLLPADISRELSKLQDQVPPFGSELAVDIIERAFGAPVDEVFAEFERQPLAAASVAQVHSAKLEGGETVVVKILRPGVNELIQRDLEVLYAIAGLAERYWQDGRRLRPVEVVSEFEKTLHRELDLMTEAANAAQLKRNFSGSDLLYVPEIYWDYCRTNVLTMERISGVPISDIETLNTRGTDIVRLAENGVEIFFTQVFQHNFFHADMHPGNIFVDVEDPSHPRYIAVDFGIMGSLSARDQHYLAANFLAFFQRDYTRVARLHVDSGWVPPDTRVDELESAVRAVCEPIFNQPLKGISFGLVLLRLFETARQFDMQVQPQLVLLQKTLLNIEGLGRQLHPELDLWKTAKPFLEDWMKRRTDPRAHLEQLLRSWPDISEDLLLLPEVIHRLVRGVVDEGSGEVRKESSPRRTGIFRLPKIANSVISGAALLIAGALWIGLDAEPGWPGWFGTAAGLLIIVRAGVGEKG